MNLVSTYFHEIIINNRLLVGRDSYSTKKGGNITCPIIRKAMFDC